MNNRGVRRPLLSRAKGGAAFFAGLALLLAACAGPSERLVRRVDSRIAARDYAGAQSLIEDAKYTSYGHKNEALYYLDLGQVQLDGGQDKPAIQSFATAERRMDELFTKSIHKELGALLLNDNTVDYAGERFERALANVDGALAYLLSGDRSGAMVEIRRLSRLLQEYSDVYGARKNAYKDDAFGEYISGLLYADAGQPDDARISFDKAEALIGGRDDREGPSAPTLRPGQGEVVFIHANGTAPRKISKSYQVAWNDAVFALQTTNDEGSQYGQARDALAAGFMGNAITVAFPAYVQGRYRIASSELDLDDGRTAPTRLIEDVSAIAMRDLSERQALIRTRAIARAAVKYILARALTRAVANRFGAGSPEALLAGIGTNALAAGTEVADTRCWTTLPSQYRVARAALAAGTHDIAAVYRDAAGDVVARHDFKGVLVRTGRRAYLYDRTAL